MDGTGRIDELEQKFAENPRRYFAPLANEYRKAGNPQRAIEICRAHLGQLPGHMSGQVVYGQALFECGEYDQAREIFEQALAMDRENLIVLRHLGDLALRAGDAAQARQWYARLLEVDPKDSSVANLVSELDRGAEGRGESEPEITLAVAVEEPEARESPVDGAAAAEAPPPNPTTAATEADEATAEAVPAAAEEPVAPPPPPHAFVTETMAELYLAQGFADLALETYRQLAELKPDDQQIRARLTELEQTEQGKPEILLKRDESPVELQPREPNEIRSPSIESPLTDAPAGAPAAEESPAGDGGSLELPLPRGDRGEENSVESPARKEPRIEPEGIAARQMSVREFFAMLGARRPGSIPLTGNGAGAGHGGPPRQEDPFSAVEEADRSAATALAGALTASAGTDWQSTREIAGRPDLQSAKESEEDLARFRAWLDGLTGA